MDGWMDGWREGGRDGGMGEALMEGWRRTDKEKVGWKDRKNNLM